MTRMSTTALTLSALALFAAAPAVAGDVASLSGSAFAGAHGVIGINQAAGSNNLQANVVALGLSGKQVGAGMLQQTSASAGGQPDGGSDSVQATVASTKGVLSGASGVVQVNQAAGTGNVTGNAISIQLR